MERIMLKSKIQEVRVTGKEIHYTGSLEIDKDLMEAADIVFGEQIHVLNVTNGSRIVTYAIPGKRGTGVISVKGAAGRLIEKGDVVLVLSYSNVDDDDLETYSHRIIYVDERNHLARVEDRTEEEYMKTL